MYTIRRTTTTTLALLSLAVAYLAAAATASAIPILPPDGIQGNVQVQPSVTPTSTVITTGSPWWTFVLAAAAGAAFAAAIGFLVARLRHARDGADRRQSGRDVALDTPGPRLTHDRHPSAAPRQRSGAWHPPGAVSFLVSFARVH
jgi:hypothetical protein